MGAGCRMVGGSSDEGRKLLVSCGSLGLVGEWLVSGRWLLGDSVLGTGGHSEVGSLKEEVEWV